MAGPLVRGCHVVLVGVVLVAYVVGVVAADKWAILVSASTSYKNYRHQADVCHAYQLLRQTGFPKDHVVVFMYDDIAYNKHNPFKGDLRNEIKGPNVYHGVPKDYNGENVTAINFLNVLVGNHAALKDVGSGKVLHSKANDDIFVFYVGHGAPGLLKFPHSRYLYATDLEDTLRLMKEHGQYRRIIFYIEACEAGSMFEDLPSNLDVYVSTASNAFEPSYATFYDYDRKAYLADLYAISWMKDTVVNLGKGETVEDQFQFVRDQTTKSTVCQFGDPSVSHALIDEFLAYKTGVVPHRPRTKKPRIPWARIQRIPTSRHRYGEEGEDEDDDDDDDEEYEGRGGGGGGGGGEEELLQEGNAETVASHDVDLMLLKKELDHAAPHDKPRIHNLIAQENALRAKVDHVFHTLVAFLVGEEEKEGLMKAKHKIQNYECLKNVMENIEKRCGAFTEYSMKYIRALANLCEVGVTHDAILVTAARVCDVQQAVQEINI
eukprot:TRINITY_DN1556_c0_g4_i1.p1 TRINITY_DN1556_c0_g4~~TRINITY_DN1556_c0_g4_i1.p1  ORF type:complete len:508 (-),score=123.02 TRINITY_DN1556_c0_g4_i1:20-1492(-)